nr:immunoglobulin light chain junction region [Macaca mulatta]
DYYCMIWHDNTWVF